MSDEINLVNVQASQIEALKKYIVALYEHDEDYEAMKNIENGVNSLMRNDALAQAYFIRRGEERIGYTILTKYHSVERGGVTMYIDELYVEEKERRNGVGSLIMKEIFSKAKEQGVKTLWAQTEPHNEAAQGFFRKHGFNPNSNLNFERQM